MQSRPPVDLFSSQVTVKQQQQNNMSNDFSLVNAVYDMDMYIFKVIVFTKQAEYE